MFISVYFIDFVVFSFIGWIYECTYCTCKTKHWQNRGFLFGPVCPIYGSGAVAAMMVFGLLPQFSAENTPIWEVFLVCAAGSAVLEFDETEDTFAFSVEAPEDIQITVQADPETEYDIYINGELKDTQKSNLGGKLSFSVDPGNDAARVEISRK